MFACSTTGQSSSTFLNTIIYFTYLYPAFEDEFSPMRPPEVKNYQHKMLKSVPW